MNSRSLHHISRRLSQLSATIVIVLATLTACSGSSSDDEPVIDPVEKSWQLVWTDDFDAPMVDPAVWRRIERGTPDWCNNMTTDDCVFEKRESSLIMRGIPAPASLGDDQQYVAGGIETSELKKFVPPFRLEMRVRMTSAQGAWPALWLMPFNPSKDWPACGEIDIMEHLNHDNMVYQTVHNKYHNIDGHETPAKGTTAQFARDEWNVFGIEVTRDAVTWTINGLETFRYARMADATTEQYPFYVPQLLRIDMQVGGSWVGSVSAAELPVEMEVDWVKYYRYK